MIRKISRRKLDLEKYNACVAQAMQSNVFGFSWYLDAVCDKWSVFVLNDYEAVMPFPWRRKFLIKYVYPPFWTMELGVYTKSVEEENEFLIELFDRFKFVEYRVSRRNHFSMFMKAKTEKTVQLCDLNIEYSQIYSKYRKDRKRDLKKAEKAGLTEKWFDDPENLIELFKKNIGKKTPNIKNKDYDRLLKLIQITIQNKVGSILSIYDNDQIMASAFLLKYKGEVILLVSVADSKNRKNGANTFLIDRAIHKYHKKCTSFNFGGSSIKKIRAYFLSFGAKDSSYYFIKQNNLPKFIKFFKR